MFGYGGSLFIGILLATFTVPLYRWFLGDYSILVVIGLGFAFSFIIHHHTAFGIGRAPQRRRYTNRTQNRTSSGKIHVDEYGRIFDPDD